MRESKYHILSTISDLYTNYGIDSHQNYKSPEQVHVQLSVFVSVISQHDVLGISKGQMLPRGAASSKLDDTERVSGREAITQFHLMPTGS